MHDGSCKSSHHQGHSERDDRHPNWCLNSVLHGLSTPNEKVLTMNCAVAKPKGCMGYWASPVNRLGAGKSRRLCTNKDSPPRLRRGRWLYEASLNESAPHGCNPRRSTSDRYRSSVRFSRVSSEYSFATRSL